MCGRERWSWPLAAGFLQLSYLVSFIGLLVMCVCVHVLSHLVFSGVWDYLPVSSQCISAIFGAYYPMNNCKNGMQRLGWIHGPQLNSPLESGIDLLLPIPLLSIVSNARPRNITRANITRQTWVYRLPWCVGLNNAPPRQRHSHLHFWNLWRCYFIWYKRFCRCDGDGEIVFNYQVGSSVITRVLRHERMRQKSQGQRRRCEHGSRVGNNGIAGVGDRRRHHEVRHLCDL